MSSLRNSLHRRNHKERSQLSHRARLGILEKHKDYVLRARDYHSKQDRITLLRQKAADRNKDEFYFGMNRQGTQGGVHVQDRGNEALPEDVVKVLKTQDENYLRTMRTAGLKKIDRLKGQLSALADLVQPLATDNDPDDVEDGLDHEELEVLREAGILAAPAKTRRRRSGASLKGKHIVFVEDEDAARQYAANARNTTRQRHDDAMSVVANEQVDLGWKLPEEDKKSKRRKSQSEAQVALAEGKEMADEERKKAATEHRTRLLKELSARLFRDRQLRYAERELEMQRLLMGKGGARKLRGVEKVESGDDGDDDEESESRAVKKVDEKTWKPRVYKWRLERKR